MRLLSACQSAMILTKQVLTVEHTGMHPFLQLLGAPLQSLYPGTALSQRELPLPQTWPCLRGSPKPQLRRDVKGSSRPSLPRGRLRSMLHLLHDSPFSSCFPNSLPKSTPQESSSIQVSLSASVPRQLDRSPLTNQGTLDEILSFSTAKYSHPQDGDNSSAFHEGVVRMKQVKSPKSPKTVPVYSKYSINAYYELLLWACFLLQENLSLRNEFMGVLWWSSG